VKPEGYRPSEELREEFNSTTLLVETRAELQRIIDAVGDAPVEPDEELTVSVEDLQNHESTRIAQDAARAAVERQLARMPTPKYTAEQLDAAEALAAYDADVKRRGPRPDYKERELVDWAKVWEQKAFENHEAATCPKCEHTFLLDKTDVDLCAIRALPTPPIPLKEIEAQLRRHDAWVNEPVEPKGARLAPEEISTGRMALALAADKPKLEADLAALAPMEDRSAELAAARRLDREWDIYAVESERHMTRVAAAADAKRELDQLPEPKVSPSELQAAYTAARIYEERLTDYAIAKERFDELSAEIAEKQQRADAFTAGAKGLVEARRTLKAFLAPSLSRVATHLIRQMTANAKRPLSEIIVDEDMNITADGQEVSTFNGAHATMINLALRLALGQVLVARVFPVFIGDEIDSDADAANSQAIADALGSVKEQLKQIILISHKRLEGVDHEVML